MYLEFIKGLDLKFIKGLVIVEVKVRDKMI